jgi:hypothetical protein
MWGVGAVCGCGAEGSGHRVGSGAVPPVPAFSLWHFGFLWPVTGSSHRAVAVGRVAMAMAVAVRVAVGVVVELEWHRVQRRYHTPQVSACGRTWELL